MRMTTLRLLILGDRKVGKSAVTVRFLTKRFIGEYYSNIDHVYRSSIRQDDSMTDVEVLDTCSKASPGMVEDSRASWADAFVIIYSICSRQSFSTAKDLIQSLTKARSSTYLPLLLLGNMTDLEHRREVGVEEGHEVALEHGCQYYEVSAADSALSVTVAFQAFLREARIVQQQRNALLKRRRSSLGSVSKKLGAMFGKNSSNSGSGKDNGTVFGKNSGGGGSCKDNGSLFGKSSPNFSGGRDNGGGGGIGDTDRRRAGSLTNGVIREGVAMVGEGEGRRRMSLVIGGNGREPSYDLDRRRQSLDSVEVRKA